MDPSERLAALVAAGRLTEDDAALIDAAPRVLERLGRLGSIDDSGLTRLITVARAWRRENAVREGALPRPHYTRFPLALIDAVALRLGAGRSVLDPFAGTMERLRLLESPEFGGHTVYGVELEPEWVHAHPHPRLEQGDATALRYDDCSFDAVVTSPSYGNRDADRTGTWWDNPDRKTYAAALGRNPSDGSLCVPFGTQAYAAGHLLAWCEAVRVLRIGGLFFLNAKNFVRAGQIQRVSQFHTEILRSCDMRAVDDTAIPTSGRPSGANYAVRAESAEKLYIFAKTAAAHDTAAAIYRQHRESADNGKKRKTGKKGKKGKKGNGGTRR